MKFILIVLLLSSCANKTEIPIPVPCFKPDQIPAEVASAKEFVTKEDADGEKIKAVLIEREQLRKSDTTFRALFSGCV